MRFLVLSFLLVGLVTCVLSSPHYSASGKKHNDSSSSEESVESDEVCSGAHEKHGCIMEEEVCEGQKADKCRKACICIKGYSRKGRDCVPTDQCRSNRVRREATSCQDPNEQYLYCGSKCPARCGDKPGSRVCTTDCVRGCFCKKGFVLNTSNKCVSPGKC